MSNLGMRIEASGFEVGFKAETREEFDSYLARLTLVAATIWPASAAAQRGIGDDEPIPEPNDLGVDYRNVSGSQRTCASSPRKKFRPISTASH